MCMIVTDVYLSRRTRLDFFRDIVHHGTYF